MIPIKGGYTSTKHEQLLANYLTTCYPWVLTPTPAFYVSDYHINERDLGGRSNYIGDLELRWLNQPSSDPVLFDYSKIQMLSVMPIFKDLPTAYHRVCFRFTDGLLMLPIPALLDLEPFLYKKPGEEGTERTKLKVIIERKNYNPACFKPVIIG